MTALPRRFAAYRRPRWRRWAAWLVPAAVLGFAAGLALGCHSAGPPPAALPPMPREVPVAEPEPAEAEEEDASPLTAAAWCPVRSRRDDQGNDTHDDQGTQGNDTQAVTSCDAGVGLALHSRAIGSGRALSVVGVIGAQTVGFGIAVTVGSTRRLQVSVAAGIVLPYDGDGIYSEGWTPALGTTVGF